MPVTFIANGRPSVFACSIPFNQQLTLWVDGSFETATCLAEILYPVVPDSKRAWCSVRTLTHDPLSGHVGLTDLFRRQRLACPVEAPSGLRWRICRRPNKSNDR